METEILDQLLLMWRDAHEEMEGAIVELQAQAAAIRERISETSAPFIQQLQDLEAQIKPLMMQRGKTYSDLPGVTASYRKGYQRVSFDSKQTDMVLGFLRDVLPDTAKQLEKARKESAVAPSVSVKVKKEG